MEQLTKNQAVATSQEAVQNHNYPLFFNETATTDIYTLSLHDALPISSVHSLVLPGVLSASGIGLSSAEVTVSTTRSEEHTSELQSQFHLVCRLLLEKKKYVNKKSDMDLAAKGIGAKEWNNSLKTKLSLLHKKLFRIIIILFFLMKLLPPTSTLFPYTTLFRSLRSTVWFCLES